MCDVQQKCSLVHPPCNLNGVRNSILKVPHSCPQNPIPQQELQWRCSFCCTSPKNAGGTLLAAANRAIVTALECCFAPRGKTILCYCFIRSSQVMIESSPSARSGPVMAAVTQEHDVTRQRLPPPPTFTLPVTLPPLSLPTSPFRSFHTRSTCRLRSLSRGSAPSCSPPRA